MNGSTQHIIQALHQPEGIPDLDIDFLRQVTERYPFYQTGQLLLCLRLHQADHFEYPEQLKRTSIQATDRERLYELLYRAPLQALIRETVETTPEAPVQEPTFEQELLPPVIEIEQPPVTEVPTETTEEPPAFEQPLPLTQVGKRPVPQEDLSFLEQEILQQAFTQTYTLGPGPTDTPQVPAEPVQEESPTHETTESQEEHVKQSFGHWLRKLDEARFQPKTIEEPAAKPDREKQASLINRFIAQEPQIQPADKTSVFTPSNLAKLSLVEDESFVTETLAAVYARQGNRQKAKAIYEKLQLKYPEKNSYFAALIEKLDSNS